MHVATIVLVLICVEVLLAVTSATLLSSRTHDSTLHPNLDLHLNLTNYKTFVARARCQSRCNAKFGIKKQGTPHEFKDLYRPFVCGYGHSICIECSSPCSLDIERAGDCTDICSTDICRDSCTFLITAVRQEEDKYAYSKRITLTRPAPACLYNPTPHEDTSEGSMIILKWNVLGPTSQSYYYPLSFVIEMKEMEANESQGQWKVMGYTNFSVIPITKLHPSTQYKFRVSAVSQDGLVTLPVTSEWIRLPGGLNPHPPQNVSVVKQYVRGYMLRAEVEWTMPDNVGCYFKLYWMTPKKGSFNSQELKEWIGFKFELNNLDFDCEYRLEIQTYNRHFQISSEKVILDFSTPSCLQSTNFNYHSCAPDAPVDFSVNISKPFEIDNLLFTNVTMSWKPPKHVSWYNTIKRYIISWRKIPDIRFTELIAPDRRVFILYANTTEWTVTNAHWDSEYIANIAAESNGGQGEKAALKLVTGNGYDQLVTQESYVTDTNKSSNSKVYYITIIPTLTAVVVTALCALFYYRIRKNSHYLENGGPARKEEINPLYEITVPQNSGDSEHLIPNDKYEVNYCCLEFTDLLGEGFFGRVLKAEFTPPGLSEVPSTVTRTVAVKMLKEHATPEERRFLLLEISAMKFLGYHPNLVSIIGCVTDENKPCLIMEFCHLGDLRNYLHQHRSSMTSSNSCTNSHNVQVISMSNNDDCVRSILYTNNTELLTRESSNTLSQATLLSYARQIAIGMEYLNGHKFIHRDLASRNILMSSHKVVKISDFGLARDVSETSVYQPTSGRCLPYKWMPIESLFDQTFTSKSDVWSYGILLWEIITLGGSPYPGIPNKDLFCLLKEGYRLGRPTNCSIDVYNIMLSCWHQKPEDRPSFTQLRRKIETLLEATCSYIDLNARVDWDYCTNSGHDSEDTEIQRDVHSYHSEPNVTVSTPLSGTSNTNRPSRRCSTDTSMCQRCYTSNESLFPLSGNADTNYEPFHTSSCHYSSDSSGPVPGLSEVLLQRTHFMANHECVPLPKRKTEFNTIRASATSNDCPSESNRCTNNNDSTKT